VVKFALGAGVCRVWGSWERVGLIAGRGGFLQDMGDLAGGGDIAGREWCWLRVCGVILDGVGVGL